jgi:hypothetical protein
MTAATTAQLAIDATSQRHTNRLADELHAADATIRHAIAAIAAGNLDAAIADTTSLRLSQAITSAVQAATALRATLDLGFLAEAQD